MIAPLALSVIAPLASSVIQPVVSSLINVISGKRVTRAGNGQEGEILSVLALPLIMKVLGKGVTTAGKRYKNIDKQF